MTIDEFRDMAHVTVTTVTGNCVKITPERGWVLRHGDEAACSYYEELYADASRELPDYEVVSKGEMLAARNMGRLADMGLEEAKAEVRKDIEAYDKSDAVNGFYLLGARMWLDKDMRVGLRNSIGIEKESGKAETTLWYGGTEYVMPVDMALGMLAKLELYALECYNVTARHLAEVDKLGTLDEVAGYDYTDGYPEMPWFDIQ